MAGPRRFLNLRSVALFSACAVLLTIGTAAGAYATFFRGATSSQTVEAGTVVIDGAGPMPVALRFADLVPGASQTAHLPLRYSGTVPADLLLDVNGADDLAFCHQASGGVWEPVPGGAVEIRVDQGNWVDYCSLLGDDESLPLRHDVGGGTDLSVRIDVRLRPGTDARYSALVESDQLVVLAEESGSPHGFSDSLTGSIDISTGTIQQVIPQQCVDAGLTDFDVDHTVYLTEGDDTYTTGKPPLGGGGFLVFGFGGNDHIVGSNQADCIDGGDGDDQLWGGNQSDVVIGGTGNDILNSPDGDPKPNGQDLLYGGDGDDLIYGGTAKDSLFGEDGDDTLVGGRGTDLVDGGEQVDVCVDGSGGDITERFSNCESISRQWRGSGSRSRTDGLAAPRAPQA